MSIGQLWYGWSATGAEGVDRQQLIAGSGKLADPKDLLTAFVLQSCYRPPGNAFAWNETNGVRVVVQRSLTGVDGRGRPGRFFVHALACHPTTLPKAVLGRLLNASVWEHEAPESPPTKLSVIRSLDELGLAPALNVSDEDLVRTLAAHLANTASGLRTALATGDGQAAALAARMAELLPERFGLLSFSTNESERNAERYDVVAGAPPSPRFAPVDPAAFADAGWIAAAGLLVTAETSEPARGAIDALAERSRTVAEFAMRVHHWVDLERAPEHDAASAPAVDQAIASIADEPRLVKKLLDGAGCSRIVSALPRSQAAFVAVRDLLAAGAESTVLSAVARTCASAEPTQALSVLERVGSLSADTARQAARQSVERWNAEDRLAQLGPRDALRALRLIATPQGQLGKAGEALVTLPLPDGAISETRLPVGWRSQIVRANPAVAEPTRLVRLLADDEALARALAEPDDALRDAITSGLTQLDVVTAERALRKLAPRAEDARVDPWWRAVYGRVATDRRLDALRVILRQRDEVPLWAASDYIDGLWGLVLLESSERSRLPSTTGVGPDLRRCAAPAMRAWGDFLSELDTRPYPNPTLACRAGTRIELSMHRDAALELLVDRVCELHTQTHPARSQAQADITHALDIIQRSCGEPAEHLSLRIARAVARRPTELFLIACFIARVARDIDDGIVDVSVVRRGPMERVARLAPSPRHIDSYTAILEAARAKPLRRWLSGILKNCDSLRRQERWPHR